MESKPNAFPHRPDREVCGHLSIESLCVEIAGRRVLAGVSLEVGQGEAVGLLGCDGAGKTTCFEAIAGLTPATSGLVRLNGLDVTDWSIDRRAGLGLAYLPEEVSIFRGLTVEENILIALEGTEPREALWPPRLDLLLEQFDLTRVRHQVATTISGGERRRCEVARAMALQPSILLLDEPFRGLDPTSVASTRQIIGSLKGRNVGVLVSDYDLHDLLELLDRVYVLHQGEVVFTGSSDQLLSDWNMRQIFLGESFSL